MERDLKAEYHARLAATAGNLRRFLDQSIGIIQLAQKGEMPEEDAFMELDGMYESWAKLLVDDLAPEEHIIV